MSHVLILDFYFQTHNSGIACWNTGLALEMQISLFAVKSIEKFRIEDNEKNLQANDYIKYVLV